MIEISCLKIWFKKKKLQKIKNRLSKVLMNYFQRMIRIDNTSMKIVNNQFKSNKKVSQIIQLRCKMKTMKLIKSLQSQIYKWKK